MTSNVIRTKMITLLIQSLFDYSVFDYLEFLKIASTKKLSLGFEVFLTEN